jgi:hypothetical protein
LSCSGAAPNEFKGRNLFIAFVHYIPEWVLADSIA